MIISAPTALWSPVLPTEEESGNVTFLISSTDPPRPSGSLQTVANMDIVRSWPTPVYTLQDRENSLGDLIFTVTKSSQKNSGSGKKTFDVGEVLDFEDSDIDQDVVALEVPEPVDLQHNTNILDYAAMGLDVDETEDLQASAKASFDTLLGVLNQQTTGVNDTKTEIEANQKSLNEVRKAIRATEILVVSSGSDSELENVLVKLRLKEEELIAEREALITFSNSLSTQAKETYNEILKLKEILPQ